MYFIFSLLCILYLCALFVLALFVLALCCGINFPFAPSLVEATRREEVTAGCSSLSNFKLGQSINQSIKYIKTNQVYQVYQGHIKRRGYCTTAGRDCLHSTTFFSSNFKVGQTKNLTIWWVASIWEDTSSCLLYFILRGPSWISLCCITWALLSHKCRCCAYISPTPFRPLVLC